MPAGRSRHCMNRAASACLRAVSTMCVKAPGEKSMSASVDTSRSPRQTANPALRARERDQGPSVGVSTWPAPRWAATALAGSGSAEP